jgi:hypothetical protein
LKTNIISSNQSRLVLSSSNLAIWQTVKLYFNFGPIYTKNLKNKIIVTMQRRKFKNQNQKKFEKKIVWQFWRMTSLGWLAQKFSPNYEIFFEKTFLNVLMSNYEIFFEKAFENVLSLNNKLLLIWSKYGKFSPNYEIFSCDRRSHWLLFSFG